MAPIGVATISNGRTDEGGITLTNVYVFNQSTSISMKDGTPFIKYDYWHWSAWGADNDGGIFGVDDEGNFLAYKSIDFDVNIEEVYKLCISFDRADEGFWMVSRSALDRIEELGKSVLIAAPELAEGETLYTVKAGDTLGKIAAAQYGKVGAYKAIFERNADRLKNANTIYEGQVIVLPAK